MHWSMAVCLVTHNTGIAQSSPDPFLCDTRWSQFSASFHARKKKKKKIGETQTFCNSLWWKLIPPSLPFQIWRETLQKEWIGTFFSTIFFAVALGCLVIDTGVRCCWYSLSETKKCGSLHRKLFVNDKHEFGGDDPHSAQSAEKVWKKECGSESGRDMIRQEQAWGWGGTGVNERQREAGSFFLENFNWLLSFSSTQLACLLHANTRS